MTNQPSWYEDPRDKMRERSVGVIALVLLFGFVAIAGTIFAYYFLGDEDLLLGKAPDDPRNRKFLRVGIEDVELVIPSKLISRVKKPTLRGVSKIDLEIPWPYDPSKEITPPEEVTDHANQIFLTFMPTPNEPTAAERFSGIYQPYIAAQPQQTSNGLYRYSFSTSSPYADIEYYAGRIGNSTIYIKCELRASSLGPQLCSNFLKVSPQTVLRYRFGRQHLSQWREIDKTARDLLHQMVHTTPGRGVTG